MGTQLFDDRGQPNPEVFSVHIRLQYDGSGVPTRLKGRGYTIVDAGTGLVDIVVDKAWNHLVAWSGGRECASAAGGSVQLVKGSENAATRTMRFRILGDADAAEDPANGDGISLVLFLTNSALPVT